MDISLFKVKSPTNDSTVDVKIKSVINGSLFGNNVVLDSNTIDVSLSTSFSKMISANTTFVFNSTNLPPNTNVICFTLQLNGAGNYTITWPSNVHWADDTVPELSQAKDLLTFISIDGGSSWVGTLSVSNYDPPN